MAAPRVLLTDLTPEECRVALQATLGDLRNRALYYDQALRRAHPVVGSVSAERFTIRRTPQGRNSFPTRVHGRFAPTAGGARIIVTAEPAPLVLLATLAVGVLALALVIAVLAPIIGAGARSPGLIILLAFLVLFFVGIGTVLRQLTRDGQDALVHHLRDTLHARPAE